MVTLGKHVPWRKNESQGKHRLTRLFSHASDHELSSRSGCEAATVASYWKMSKLVGASR